MANFNFFDLDTSLQENLETKDFKDIYNEEAVNQSMEIFITNPYRAGKGLTNQIFNIMFSDMNSFEEDTIASLIESDFRENYSLISFKSIEVIANTDKKRYRITIDWFIPKTNISGTFDRFWSQAT